MIKVAVTGKNGQVGRCLQDEVGRQRPIEAHFFSRETWDITSAEVGIKNLDASFDYLINTAAYTAVDQAESDEKTCMAVNFEAVQHLVQLCNDRNVHLIHISSDYVYGGDHFRPNKESDTCHPSGIYARSKLLADEWIVSNCRSATIIRSSWIYSAYGHNFIKTILSLCKTKEQIRVVQDQWGCPTSAHDLAKVIIEVISNDLHIENQTTIWNYTQMGCTNWYEIACEIVRHSGDSTGVIPIPSSEYPTAAQRPKNSLLNCTKFDRSTELRRQFWKSSLRQCLDLLQV